jgi:hypothetical protein
MAIAANRRPRGRPRVQDAARKRNNVTIRMRDGLKSKVEQSAVAQQRSISEEIETRLERSFEQEDHVGGSEMQAIISRVTAAFLHGGRLGAISRGHPEWGPDRWMQDELARKVAIAAAVDELRGVETISAAMTDRQGVERVLTAMIARGALIRATNGDDE